MFVLRGVGDALAAAGSMGWEILWPLVLGFTLSGIIQAIVRTDQITKLMRDDSPRAISVAT
ncbi:permease, partial [Curtobacterium albidum]